MKLAILVRTILIAISSIASIAIADTERDSSALFDFKGDQLGMSLDDFKAKHRDPGEWKIGQQCQNGKCRPNRVWISQMSCKSYGVGITVCSDRTTIVNRDANLTVLFIDNKLASFRVSFAYSQGQFNAVTDAMSTKIGLPASQQTDRSFGMSIHWANGTSAAMLSEHNCVLGGLESDANWLLGWAQQIADVIAGNGCKPSAPLDYQNSHLVLVQKNIGALAIKRVDEYRTMTSSKARSDI